MYDIGDKELKAIEKVIKSGKMFRYNPGNQCGRFEQRWGKYLGAKYVTMTSSGTTAISAALISLDIGPGDEVIVPAHTYMATATAVLSVGAIPVVCDIDETITLDPVALDKLIGPQTKAVIPVHMWGVPCDMDAIMKVARKHKIFVIEDACQAVGGSYKGNKLATIGHAGAFSFNAFKNLSCGEGGSVVVKTAKQDKIVRCVIDCCNFFWEGKSSGIKPFASNGSRASEIEGAIMNVQLDRLGGILKSLRQNKKRMLKNLSKTALEPVHVHDLEGECASMVKFKMPSARAANKFSELTGAIVCGKTGRHTYTEWDQVLQQRGAYHPQMNPYNMDANKKCRKNTTKASCKSSLDILSKTVMLRVSKQASASETAKRCDEIARVADKVLK